MSKARQALRRDGLLWWGVGVFIVFGLSLSQDGHRR
jgi:hypothetical protein